MIDCEGQRRSSKLKVDTDRYLVFGSLSIAHSSLYDPSAQKTKKATWRLPRRWPLKNELELASDGACEKAQKKEAKGKLRHRIWVDDRAATAMHRHWNH